MRSIKRWLPLAFLFVASKVQAVTHPFLIITTSTFANAISSSTSHPWSDMKSSALTFLAGKYGVYGFNNGSPMPAAQDLENQMIELQGINAMLYVLNTGNSGSITYRNNIIGMLNSWDSLWALEQADPTAYSANSPLNSAFFSSVLALDIIYPDLTPTQRNTYETEFSSYIGWNNSHPSSWQLANYSSNALWAIFLGTSSANIAVTTTTYMNGILYPGDSLSELNDVGGFAEGSLYAYSRLAGESLEKMAKWGLPHVLQYTGKSNIYGNAALKNFFEWLYSGFVTPFNYHVPIGDTNNDYLLGDNYWDGTAGSSYTITNGDLTVGNYSTRAAAWSSRFANAAPKPLLYPNDILTYQTATGAFSASTPSVSVVTNHIGASFWDEDQSTAALMGVLWNAKQTRWDHLHREQNGLYLAAYGESVLSNCGDFFNGTIGGFPNSWCHDNATSANVVLIGNKNHASNLKADFLHPTTGGDGITEYFTGTYFDYVSAYSSTTYAGMGSDTRNFLFIHPQDSSPGYWAVLDEINTSTYNFVNVLWHPYGVSPSTTTTGKEWAWSISDRNTSTTTLTVFLGNAPNSISFSSGVFQGKGGAGSYGLSSYLNAQYTVDTSSNVRSIAVLFPSNSTHSKATFTQLAPTNGKACEVDNGPSTDWIGISTPSLTSNFGEASYKGKVAYVHTVAGHATLSSYFVKDGTDFNDLNTTRTGFNSTVPISLYIRDYSGLIYSTATTSVTFYFPNITGLRIDGVYSPGLLYSSTFTVTVGSGTHSLAFSTGTARTPSDVIPSNFQLFPSSNVWNTDVSSMPISSSNTLWMNIINGHAGHQIHADFGTSYQSAYNGIPYNVIYSTQGTPSGTVVPLTTYATESDTQPTSGVPIPLNAIVENDPVQDPNADRHLLILDVSSHTLYEMYKASRTGEGTWTAAQLTIWNTDSNAMRQLGWTSADAGGLALLPGLIKYNEVNGSGEINHAFRFTLELTHGPYIWPASHDANSGGVLNPPFGMRVRMKANYDISGFSAANQKIFRAMKKYGMIMADNGGDWFVSGAPSENWNTNDLALWVLITAIDAFEVVDESTWIQSPTSYAAVDPSTTGQTQSPRHVLTGKTKVNGKTKLQ